MALALRDVLLGILYRGRRRACSSHGRRKRRYCRQRWQLPRRGRQWTGRRWRRTSWHARRWHAAHAIRRRGWWRHLLCTGRRFVGYQAYRQKVNSQAVVRHASPLAWVRCANLAKSCWCCLPS